MKKLTQIIATTLFVLCTAVSHVSADDGKKGKDVGTKSTCNFFPMCDTVSES